MRTEGSLLNELAALGIRPKKGLGQNFLVDGEHRARIIDAAGISPSDIVLEIGPGPGVLTGPLAELAGRVVAVELDDRLIPFLRARFGSLPHVSIVHGDIMALDPGALAGGGAYKVVANLPYYITSAVIRRLLEASPPPDVLVLTVQREVAERMAAQPPDMSLLALGVQFYTVPRIVGRIPAGAFYPVPKVDSAVVRLDRRPAYAVAGVAPDNFFAVARAGFSQPRKQLRNSLGAGLSIAPARAAALLESAAIDPSRRAETLDLEEWGALARVARPG